MNDQSKLLEVYSRLKALRVNIPERHYSLGKRWVDEFHDLLTTLANLSQMDLSGFRVPQSAVTDEDADIGTYYDKEFVAAKIDALLGFFELRFGERKPSIGFHPSE